VADVDQGNEWDFYPGLWKDKTMEAATFGFDGSCELDCPLCFTVILENIHGWKTYTTPR
jgi:hypothetical protein